jgi:hypothetical protein
MITNREWFERLIFSRKINKLNDLIIRLNQLNFTLLHHHYILHAWTIWLRIASAYLRRFVSSILHQFVDFVSSRFTIIQSIEFIQVEMISFIFIDFRSSRDQWARKWVCNFDEIRSKWQRSSKMTWSEEKILMTNEDLDFSERFRWIMKWGINKWDCRRKNFYIMSWFSHLD